MRRTHAYAEICVRKTPLHALFDTDYSNLSRSMQSPRCDEECEMMFPENVHRMCDAFAAICQGSEANVEGVDVPISP